jgi:hypothetical protein
MVQRGYLIIGSDENGRAAEYNRIATIGEGK